MDRRNFMGLAAAGLGALSLRMTGCADPRLADLKFNIKLASLTEHNTSAFSNYSQSQFPANFGTTSYVSRTQTINIDPAKMDMSMNPATPAHVSGTDIHTLIPSRPDLRWFAHLMPWWGSPGEPFSIGLNVNTASYVQSLVTDLMNRGFDGVEISWNGTNSPANEITLKIQSYLKTIPHGAFKFLINVDQGLVHNAGTKGPDLLQGAVRYFQQQYFSDVNYEAVGGVPLLLFYGVRPNIYGGAATMATVKAATGGNMIWAENQTSYLNEDWSDQCYGWVNNYANGVNSSDPYNLKSVTTFLSSVGGQPKQAIGALACGFNGTLSGPNWSLGKYLPRASGDCWMKRAAAINANIPANVTRMHVATWNDYPEGSSIEGGIENDVTVAASIQGRTLNWTVTSGTGDESTIDHYEIYASLDGINAALLGSVPPGTHSFDLGFARHVAAIGSCQVIVDAIGKPCIRDHVSNPVPARRA